MPNLFTLFFLSITLLFSTTSAKLIAKIATFDDIPGATSAGAPPVPQLYRGLDFSKFRLAARSPVATIVLQPSSGKNFAVSPLLQKSVTFQVAGGNNYFNLNGLKAGCYASTANGLIAPPVQCVLTIVGKSGKDLSKTVASYNFTYKVNGLLGVGAASQPVSAVPLPANTFKNLGSVTITVTQFSLPVGALDSALQFAIDDVKFDLDV